MALIESQEELEALQAEHPVLFITIYDTDVDSDWNTTYTKVA